MNIAIYANLPSAGSGGVQSYLGALIRSLGELSDGNETYVLLAEDGNKEWMLPLLGPNQRIELLHIKKTKLLHKVARRLFLLCKKMKIDFQSLEAPQYSHRLKVDPFFLARNIAVSSGLVESLNVDLIHFPFQTFFVSSLPTIYNPHDLQHLHFPQFFSPTSLLEREITYPFACRLANRIAVASDWIASDISTKYSIPREKFAVIPWGGATAVQPTPTMADINAVIHRYSLPKQFVFYPAIAWPHKNHFRLIDAIGVLKRRGDHVSLVLTGSPTELNSKLKERAAEIGVENLVTFLGHIPSSDIRAVYQAARAVIVPTLFEAASGPVAEAWQEGVPVACSDIPQLREQAEGAAVFFDPFMAASIADAIAIVSKDHQLRANLISAGKEKTASLSWRNTAISYRQLYRETIVAAGGF